MSFQASFEGAGNSPSFTALAFAGLDSVLGASIAAASEATEGVASGMAEPSLAVAFALAIAFFLGVGGSTFTSGAFLFAILLQTLASCLKLEVRKMAADFPLGVGLKNVTRNFLELSELLELLDLYKKTISRIESSKSSIVQKFQKILFYNPFEVPLKAGRRTFFSKNSQLQCW